MSHKQIETAYQNITTAKNWAKEKLWTNEKSRQTSQTTAKTFSRPSESTVERVWRVRLYYEWNLGALGKVLSSLGSPTKAKRAILHE